MKRTVALTRILSFSPHRRARLRLFCFPFAGGGISAYRSWTRELPGEIELCAVQPPGREGNYMDRPFTDLHLLVADIRHSMEGWLDLPFAFFGHSMGALISFELARSLRENGDPLPVKLFLSAHRPPEKARPARPLHLLPDDDLIAELGALGGTPAEVLTDAHLLKVMLPVIRADFAACFRYVYSEQEPLDIPLTVYGGVADRTVHCTDLSAWERHTRSAFYLQLFPGNHFFLQHNRSAFLKALSDPLADLLPRREEDE